MTPVIYSNTIKEEAVKLRARGNSINQIASKLKIAQSTAHKWVKKVKLNSFAKKQIELRKEIGKQNAKNYQIQKKAQENEQISKKVKSQLVKMRLNKQTLMLLCSFLYWAEGSKSLANLTFINSDPLMIKTFLYLFRSSFKVDESKFR